MSEFPSYIDPNIFPYDTASPAHERVHLLNEYCTLLDEEIKYHLTECEKMGYTKEDVAKIDIYHDKLEKDLTFYRIGRIKNLQKENDTLFYLMFEILSELPEDDPERKLINLDPKVMNLISYFNYNPKTETAESVKDSIFTEDNVKRWEVFAKQLRIEDFCEILRRAKNASTLNLMYAADYKPVTREEIRFHKTDDLYLITGEYEVRRFVSCCFIAAFNYSHPTTDEWLTPNDILAAIHKYNVKLEFNASIEDDCEWLRRMGYLEKHPDDADHEENTRYRIKY